MSEAEEPKCCRSHPHENMSEWCRQQTIIARLTAEKATLKCDLEAAVNGLRNTLKHMERFDEYVAIRIMIRSDIASLQRIVDSAGQKEGEL